MRIGAVMVAAIAASGIGIYYASTRPTPRSAPIAHGSTVPQRSPTTGSSSTAPTSSTAPFRTPSSTVGQLPDIQPATPAVAPTRSCPTAGAHFFDSLTIVLTNNPRGFSQSCYYVESGLTLPTRITDEIVNPSSGLTDPMEFTVSSLKNPAVVSAVGTELVLPENELFVSPTAPDANPISFTVPPIPAGQYYLQLVTLRTAPAALLTVS